MTTVYLIRHSTRIDKQYIEKYLTSDSSLVRNEKDILSIEGERRAELLSNEPELSNIDKIYTSKCVRTLQTAKYLMEKNNLQATIDERLDERRVGIPNEGKHPDWFVKQYTDKDFKTENGESQNEVVERLNEVINEIVENNQDKRIAIFSHGYAICFYLLQYSKLDYIDADKKIRIKYKNKVLLDGLLNAPEVFKLTFDKLKLVDIDHIEFADLKQQ